MRPQLVLERRTGRARLDSRRTRRAVHVENLVEPLQVDRDRSLVALVDPRLDASDDAGSAAERDRGGAGFGTPREHALELALVVREGDHVRRVVEPAAKGAHDVAVGLAVGVRGAVVYAGRADPGERRRRLETGCRQLDVLERDRQLDLLRSESEVADDPRSGAPQLVGSCCSSS